MQSLGLGESSGASNGSVMISGSPPEVTPSAFRLAVESFGSVSSAVFSADILMSVYT